MLTRSNQKRPNPLKIALAVVFAVVLAFGLFEALLQAIANSGDSELARFIAARTEPADADSDLAAMLRFARGKGIEEHLRQFEIDAELGWRPIANLTFIDAVGNVYSTDRHGFRDSTRPSAQARRRLVVVGDSFSWGSDITDGQEWPAQLQAMDSTLDVVNLAVAAYGIDQMYLRLRRHIQELAPELVIAAFISDDLHRSLRGFRGYQKPKFILLDNGQLQLTNVPIPPDADALRRAIWREHWPALLRASSRTLNLLDAWRPKPTANFDVEMEAVMRINRALFGAMAELTRRHRIPLWIVYLPWGDEINGNMTRSEARILGELHAQQLTGVTLIDLRPEFSAAGGVFSPKHYGQRESGIVAAAIQRRLQTTVD